jgi:hypothetical protein
MVALDDWLHIYAADQCDPGKVAKTELRIFRAGGPIAYIAAVQHQNRVALRAREEQTKIAIGRLGKGA